MTLTRKNLLKSCRFAHICWQKSPPSLQISSNLPLQIYWSLLAEIPPPQFADFLKPATTDLLKSAGRNPPPPSLQISSNLPLQIYWNLLAEIPPSLQISSNLPLQIYWNLLAEIPPVCRFPQICHQGHLHERPFTHEGNYLVKEDIICYECTFRKRGVSRFYTSCCWKGGKPDSCRFVPFYIKHGNEWKGKGCTLI